MIRLLLILLRVVTWPWRISYRALRKRRFWKGFLVIVLAVMLLAIPRSTRVLSPAEYAARGYEYGLVGWEVTNFLDKWVHRVRELLPGVGSSTQEKREALARSLMLNDEIEVARDADRETIEGLVMASPDVARYLGGRAPRKMIVVPGRIVNVVV